MDFILDTDLSIDVDDVGALCVAHALTDNGAHGDAMAQIAASAWSYSEFGVGFGTHVMHFSAPAQLPFTPPSRAPFTPSHAIAASPLTSVFALSRPGSLSLFHSHLLRSGATPSVTGEGNLLAVVHSSNSRYGVGAISVINNYYGRDSLDVGG